MDQEQTIRRNNWMNQEETPYAQLLKLEKMGCACAQIIDFFSGVTGYAHSSRDGVLISHYQNFEESGAVISVVEFNQRFVIIGFIVKD